MEQRRMNERGLVPTPSMNWLESTPFKIADVVEKYPTLNKRQLDAIESVFKKKNVFITGKAGAGKSFVINVLKEFLKDELVVTSSTGISAVNIGGQTLHSFFKVNQMNDPIDFHLSTCNNSAYNRESNRKIASVKRLLVDEVSMLSSKHLNYIDCKLRKLKADNRPFGGAQVILVGDFCQLPFVEGWQKNNSGFEQKLCFEDDIWKRLNLETHYLDSVVRQKDPFFIDLLDSVRSGALKLEHIAFLREKQERYSDSDIRKNHGLTILCATNSEVDEINTRSLAALDTEEMLYTSVRLVGRDEELDTFEKNQKLSRVLALKKGCEVMLTLNYSDEKKLANGSRGVVVDFVNGLPLVKFDTGVEIIIEPQEVKHEPYDIVTKRKEVILMVKQIPLMLSYAVTVHKSQGMTLDGVVLDINKTWSPGHFYTALSRCKSLENLYIKRLPQGFPGSVVVDKAVSTFYKNIEREMQERENF